MRSCIVLTLAALALAPARAGEFEVYTQNVPLMSTDWAQSIDFPQFDPAGGRVLQAVILGVEGDFQGAMRVENLDALDASRVNLRTTWTLHVNRPGDLPFVSLSDFRERSPFLDPFDGNVNFAGPSGRSYTFSFPLMDEEMLSGAGELAPFIGSGTVGLPAGATAVLNASAIQGANNFDTDLAAGIGANITLTYAFVPEPAGLAALLGFGLLVLRRRAARNPSDNGGLRSG